MKRSGKNGNQWMFPEQAEVLRTMGDQIHLRQVVVEYYGSVTIRCRLSDDVVSHVGQLLSSINLSNE